MKGRAMQGMNTAGWADEYVTMIVDCENREQRLSDWERGFVDSLRTQIEAGRRPSSKSAEKLDDIWNRATARG